MLIDPESVKKIDNLTVFLNVLGSARVKAARRTLMKLSSDSLMLRSTDRFEECMKKKDT